MTSGGVAGHEQTLEVGIDGQQVLGKVPTVHLGHDHVGHEQVNFAGMFMGQADGLTRRSSGQTRYIPAF